MSSITISYALNQLGQKASLLAGGNGKAEQFIKIGPDHAFWSLAVGLTEIDKDGAASIKVRRPGLWSCREYDHVPTVEELLDGATEDLMVLQAEAAKRQAEEDAWCLLPLSERIAGGLTANPPSRYSPTHVKIDRPEWVEADRECAHRNAADAAAEREQRAREAASEAAQKQAGKDSLREWALEHGSELLRARMAGEYEWVGLAEQEYADQVVASVTLPVATDPPETIDRDYAKRLTPTLTEIKALKALRYQLAEGEYAELVWVKYTIDDEDETLDRTAIVVTVTCPTGRKIERFYLAE